jgi:hypothetical protein
MGWVAVLWLVWTQLKLHTLGTVDQRFVTKGRENGYRQVVEYLYSKHVRSSTYILYYYAVQQAEVCSESAMTDPTMCSEYFGSLLHKAAQCASIQRLHGVVSRKYIESYLQCTVQSLFSFGLDSAARLSALALHSRSRGRTQKGLWAPNQWNKLPYLLFSRMR